MAFDEASLTESAPGVRTLRAIRTPPGENQCFWRLSRHMRGKGAKLDREIARIAVRQHGIVSIGQLLEVGIGEDAIHRRVAVGRLHRVHRGVYAVGHAAFCDEARWIAAVLACGSPGRDVASNSAQAILDHWRAALSHRSAAELWRLLSAREGPVDVSIQGSGGRKRRSGIRLHRSVSLFPAHVTLCNGIPVTTPARTIADLRRVVSRPSRRGLVSSRQLRRAIRQAEVLGLPLGDEVERDRTRSDLERDFLRLCDRHGLPAPEVNLRIGPYLVDFLWRDCRLIVETDGYAYHRGRAAFQDDRARDLELRAEGFDVIRLAEKQVEEEPGRVAELLAAAIQERGPTGTDEPSRPRSARLRESGRVSR